MNRNALIGVIVGVVLIVGGAAAYLLTNNDNEESVPESNSQSNNSESAFNPISTEDSSFEAVLTTTTRDDEVIVATIESDGEGNSKYSGQQGDNSFETYSLNNGDYITCTDNTCYKINAGEGANPVDEDTYEYSEEDFNDFSSNAVYVGKADCPAGTCDHWEVSSEGQKINMYLDSQRRISKVSGSTEDGDYEIVYDYKDVSITVPENVSELPGQL